MQAGSLVWIPGAGQIPDFPSRPYSMCAAQESGAMAIIEWNSTLSVNIQQFDRQHMKLVDMINKLHEGIRASNANEVLGEIINDLARYTTTHFADEEQIMATYQYPDIAAHKAEHMEFSQQVRKLELEFRAGQTIVPLGVMIFLKNWLVSHIQVCDKKLGIYLKEKGL